MLPPTAPRSARPSKRKRRQTWTEPILPPPPGLPTLSARGALGYKNAELPDINALTFNWTAGLLLNVPCSRVSYTVRQIEEGAQRLAAAKENTAAVRRTLTTQVLQAYQDLMSARQQVVIAGTVLDQARRMVDVAKIQYRDRVDHQSGISGFA